ncbi:hypothetical protein ACRE_030500 [Hapsidospora chrysogenum ATCC 11550]|uniref:Uncharacterized protein n=1 Tax=Hapsidospora chrysogenum (strain ATCC 11550 / CBS 779.69 / DSM 880 / IAM 14645 / JCM 23072 / IMI 49137) TaxID=857340 RepID=A0A086T9R0_HAPC1|nr:hypothetical protein ACRE_030500 [Hapsidospora chrysogenum ATCC 11550]
MVAQAGIRSDDETIDAIIALHDNPVNTLPRWLKINLFVSRITVCCMVVLGGPAIIAFGIMTRNDLRNDPDDSNCDMKYIEDASEPWPQGDGYGLAYGPGRYHSQCRLLLSWSYIMVVAGSLSVGRLIPEILIPYDAPFCTPSRVYALQAAFSLVPCLLYIASLVILSTSPAVIGPRAEYGLGIAFFLLPMIALSLAILVTAHQCFAAIQAARRLVGWQKYSSIPGGPVR